MMKYVGLHIMLEGSHFLRLCLSETEARDILAKWQSRHFHLKDVRIISNQDYPGHPTNNQAWALETERIVAMHTFDWEQMIQQTGSTNPPSPPRYFTSN